LTSTGYTKSDITFADGRFDSAPWVLTSMHAVVPGGAYMGCAAADVTARGCELWVYRTNTNTSNVHWVALRPTSRARLWTPGGPADLGGIFDEFANNTEAAIPRIDSGGIEVPGGGGVNSTHIEFQPGLFTEPPAVIVTAGTSSATVVAASAGNGTATG